VTVKVVFVPGVSVDGAGVQLAGAAVTPAAQLKVTELVYPFRAMADPLNVAFCPTEMVCGELETASWKSGVATRLNCQIPRP